MLGGNKKCPRSAKVFSQNFWNSEINYIQARINLALEKDRNKVKTKYITIYFRSWRK